MPIGCSEEEATDKQQTNVSEVSVMCKMVREALRVISEKDIISLLKPSIRKYLDTGNISIPEEGEDEMMQFTKGNWIDIGSNVFTTLGVDVEHDTPIRVAEVFGKNEDEKRANAILVSHAPDMYNMLVSILDDVQNKRWPSEDELIELLNSINGEDWE